MCMYLRANEVEMLQLSYKFKLQDIIMSIQTGVKPTLTGNINSLHIAKNFI